MINSRWLLLRCFAVTTLLVLICLALLPLALDFLVGDMPYLHSTSVVMRFIWSSGFVFFTALICRLSMTKIQWQKLKRLTLGGWKDVVGVLFGALLATYAIADGYGNVLGALVAIFPESSCAIQSEVLTAIPSGSNRRRSVTINLLSWEDGQTYYLTLSRSMFDYPKLRPGDLLLIEGKKNYLGAYIEEISPLSKESQGQTVR